MPSLQEYYTQKPLKEDINDLSNPDLDPEKDRQVVNELVLNLVIKYFARYLEIKSDNILEIRGKIRNAISESDKDVNLKSLLTMISGQPPTEESLKSDVSALQPMSDLHATSAIVKEIIFKDFDLKGRNRSLVLDLGSGTGILLVAGLINASRKGIRNIEGVGIELQEDAVTKSRKAINGLFPYNHVNIARNDILSPELHHLIAQSPYLTHWISETIGISVPKMEVHGTNLEIKENGSPGFAKSKILLNGILDPFPMVLGASLEHIPNFQNRVKSGEIAMFPDLINGNFQPNDDNTAMKLDTSPTKDPIPLHHIGQEFYPYEDLGSDKTRW